MYIKYILCIFDNRKKETMIHLKKKHNEIQIFFVLKSLSYIIIVLRIFYPLPKFLPSVS